VQVEAQDSRRGYPGFCLVMIHDYELKLRRSRFNSVASVVVRRYCSLAFMHFS
jgi:hypothetical protein